MTKILNGLILSGGKSSRMGKDKNLINYHGKPQRDHLIDMLKPYCDQVFISGARGSKASLTVIPDHFDVESPLNGILSAFHYDPEAAWITIPIDMPNIDAKIIEYLLKNRSPQHLATCFLDSSGESPEPLFTIWEAKSKPALFDFFNSGGESLRKFLEENDVHTVRAPNPNVLININTESELEAFLGKSVKLP